MALYLLDTNHLSPLVTLGHRLQTRVLAGLAIGDEFAIPVSALTEFLFGIQMTARAASNLQEWARLQDSFGYYTIDRRGILRTISMALALGWQHVCASMQRNAPG